MNYIVRLGERRLEVTPFPAVQQLLKTEIRDRAFHHVVDELQPGESFVINERGRSIAAWPKGEDENNVPAQESR